jgi:tRNA(fMet)-specific endonuclease VapC
LTHFLLDTNVCIRLLNPNRNELLVRKLKSLNPEQVFLCSIVKAELYYGAYRSNRCDENLALLEQFFNPFATLPFDERCEKTYGQIRADLALRGNLIGVPAATLRFLTLRTMQASVFNRLQSFGWAFKRCSLLTWRRLKSEDLEAGGNA